MGNAASPKDSNGRDKVQCLVCKLYFHRLDFHLPSHNLTIATYREMHGADVPLASDFAKEQAKKKPGALKSAVASLAEHDSLLRLGAAQLVVRVDTEDDAAFIPAHDEHYTPGKREMEQWEALGLALEAGENALIVGPTGCGKSTAALELAAVAAQPVRRMNLHGDVRAADFVGEKVIEVDPESGQAVVRWRDGLLPAAMRAGHWLLLDELDAAPPQILFVLQGVLERGAVLVLSANHGEIVEAAPTFRVIATANTLGRGDEAGLYAGTNVLNEAFLDRFGIVIEADYPDKDTEARILVNRTGIRPETARRMVECATMVRESWRKEECFCTFSTRRLIAWGSKAKKMNRAYHAAKLTVLNRLAGEDRKYVQGVIERNFPPKMDVLVARGEAVEGDAPLGSMDVPKAPRAPGIDFAAKAAAARRERAGKR